MSFPSAVTFLWRASLRNRVRKQLERLRQPKYLAGMVVGGVYMYFVVLRRLRLSFSGEPLPPTVRAMAELGLAAMLMATLAAAWVLGEERPSLTFTETEVQLLFPAPISRRGLLHYKLARGVVAAMLTALFSTVFFGRGLSAHPVLFFLGATVVLTTVNLHGTAASFVRTRLVKAGWVGKALRWTVLLGLFAAFGLAAYRALQAHPFPQGDTNREVLEAWISEVLQYPALKMALWPVRALVALPLADGAGEFLRLLPVVLGVLGLHYLWVAVLVVPFEEAVVIRAETAARERGQRLARVGHIVLRKPFFALHARGRPEVALLWKNLTASRRVAGTGVFLVLPLLGLAYPLGVAFFAPESLHSALQFMSLVYVAFAGMMTVFGPVSIRSDLRMDLPKLDMLRAMPLTGRQVVLAELLAPWLLLTAIQVFLLALGVAMGVGSPGLVEPGLWVAGGLGLALLLPALVLGGLLVQNAAVVLFPSWLPPDGERARGIEAMGQRLLTLAGTLVVVIGGLLPAAFVAALVGFALYGVLGIWALPFAGLTASAGLVAEVALGVVALGRAFDRMDVSSEGTGAP